MNPFWYLITGLSFLVAIVNFSIALSRRKEPMVALARGLAGLVSLVAGIGIIVGKEALHYHPPFPLEWQTVIMVTGVFIFAVLLLPSYVGRGEKTTAATLQERAARPTNATIRLRDKSSDEWVN